MGEKIRDNQAMDQTLVATCKSLLASYESGEFGDLRLPEDSAPKFSQSEFATQLAFFGLPMALNYQRNSDRLWSSALATHQDQSTSWVYDVASVAHASTEGLRNALLRHGLALQPQRHVRNWEVIATAVHRNWGSFEGLLAAADHDFLNLRRLVRVEHKREFPYLSGPKLFNYWAFILTQRCGVALDHSEWIDIAADTHIRQASVRLSVISPDEAARLDGDQVAERWRGRLAGTDVTPSALNVCLWSWSRSSFPSVSGVATSDLYVA